MSLRAGNWYVLVPVRPATHRISSLIVALGAVLVTRGASASPPRHGVVTTATYAHAHGHAQAHARPGARASLPPDSRSVGYANGGALSDGTRLSESESIRYLPGRSLHYGTAELVGLIDRVGAALRRRFRIRLTVGDLSARNGGPVGHHVSHQSGRDADIAFFVRDVDNHPVELDDLVSFDPQGHSMDGHLRFDTPRNWAFLEALFTDRRVRTERVFISTPLRARLLEYARAHGRGDALARAQATLVQPANVSPHDNHFHIRIGCPGGDATCREGVRLRRRPGPRHAARGARGAHGAHAPPRRAPARTASVRAP